MTETTQSGSGPTDRSRSTRLAEVLEEIEEIRHRRDTIDAEDFSGMLELTEQRRALQIEATRLRTDLERPATTSQIHSELEAIEQRLAAIDASHVDVVKQAGGGSAGGDFAFAIDAQKLNQQIDEGADRPALEARARQLRLWIEDGLRPDRFDSI